MLSRLFTTTHSVLVPGTSESPSAFLRPCANSRPPVPSALYRYTDPRIGLLCVSERQTLHEEPRETYSEFPSRAMFFSGCAPPPGRLEMMTCRPCPVRSPVVYV